jgi:DNA-binding NarL/FixJ family response regulator
MYASSFQVLFLGEDFAWSKLSPALADAARFSLKVHRAQSLNELFLILAGGGWHAVIIDIQAWNFQGLHYVDKIRSEYPVLPILALYSSEPVELSLKAKNTGASRALLLEHLSADGLHLAILSCLSEKKSPTITGKSEPKRVTVTDVPDSAPATSSKTQVISHALNNLLCVISANAEIASEHLAASGPATRSLFEIKKAAKAASDLARLLA